MNYDDLKDWCYKNKNKILNIKKWYYKIPVIGRYMEQRGKDKRNDILKELFKNINKVISEDIKNLNYNDKSRSYINNLHDVICRDRMDYGRPNWKEIIENIR